jgi:Uma2 family endonuclease
MAIEAARRRFTVDEYEQMGRAGILGEDDRVELIDGEIIQMSPIGSRHAGTVAKLAARFGTTLSTSAIVWVQNPIRLEDYAEPQPDIALLQPREDFYTRSHPRPADVLLIVEVAETSIRYDRGAKMRQYARAGIADLWVADFEGECVWVYREPMGDSYRVVRRVRRGQRIAPLAFPELSISVDDLLGEQTP